MKSFWHWRGPLGCKLSVHWIPQHNPTFPGTCEGTPRVPGHFWYLQCGRCSGTPWSAGDQTHFPASDLTIGKIREPVQCSAAVSGGGTTVLLAFLLSSTLLLRRSFGAKYHPAGKWLLSVTASVDRPPYRATYISPI